MSRLLLCIVVTLAINLFGQSLTLKDQFVYSGEDLYRAPAKWTVKDYSVAAITFGAFSLAYSNDKALMDFVQNHKGDFSYKLAFVGEKFGNGMYVGGLYSASAILAFIKPDNKSYEAFYKQGFSSAFYTSAIIMGLKHIIQRKRPFMAKHPYEFGSVWRKPHYHSLPSGHTAMAFNLASMIDMHTEKPIWGILAYSMASITAWSRVHDQKHWVSDVILGGVIGTVVSRSVINSYKKRKP